MVWATTQNNLGSALTSLGELEGGTARLEEAVTAYREALKERRRDRMPVEWTSTQINLGNALTSLGERSSGTTQLEEAVSTYSEALEVNADVAPHDQSVVLLGLAHARELLDARKSQSR